MIKLERALAHLSMSQNAFLNMCITAGCDYLPNVGGIGIHTAQKLVIEKEDFLATLQGNKYAPINYSVGFQKAKAVFLHQTVINPADVSTIPLSPWEEAPDAEFLNSCGMYPVLILIPFSLFISPLTTHSAKICKNFHLNADEARIVDHVTMNWDTL